MPLASLVRHVRNMEIEEKILNAGALIALIGVFLPWFGGEWFGEPHMWSGFGFYTNFIGILIFLGQLFILSIAAFPMLGYHVVRSSLRDPLRLIIGLQTVVLMVVAFSIFTNMTFDYAHVEVRFGVHVTLIGGIVESIYAFLRIQQRRKQSVEQFFHQPEVQHQDSVPSSAHQNQHASGDDSNLFSL